MSGKQEIVCTSCGESVIIGKFCPKCGVALPITPAQEYVIQKQRLEEASDKLVDFEESILKTLAPEYQAKFSEIKTGIDTAIRKIEQDIEYLLQEDKEKSTTICLSCSNEVTASKFCQKCGKFLGETKEENMQTYAQHLLGIQNNIIVFRRSTEKILAKGVLGNLNTAFNNMRQVILYFSQKEPIVPQTEKVLVPTKETKIITKTSTPTTTTSAPTIQQPAPTPVQLESRPERKKNALYSRFERNLLDYWFFYLATIIFSVGISITLYFVSVELESETWQLVIIYSIGAVIIAAGQTLALVMSRRKKKRKEKMEATEITDDNKKKEKKKKQEDTLRYTPQMSSVILFIGFIVLFVGGIIGILSYQSLGVSKGVFIGLSLGLCAVCMAISIINNSEFLALTSILQAIVFVAVDLLWAQYPPILGNVSTLIVYLLLIIASTCIAVFFKKWTVTAVTMAILPIMLCIPRMYTQIGLEFLILILIPIMVILTIQFGSEKTPMPIKRSFVVLSFLLPLIAIFVITLTSFYRPIVEPSWASYQSYQSLIIGVVFIGVAYYYQFIQEKHLDIKTSNEIIWFSGQAFTGIVSFLNVGLYKDTLITSLFFLIFFVFGVLSTLKVFRDRLSVLNIITSFLIAEILAILVITLVNITKISQEVLLFLLGISFLLLAIVSLFIPQFLHRSNVLFLVWDGLAIVNLLLLGLLQKIDPWYVFAIIIICLCTSIITSLPIIIPKVPNWRDFSLYTILLNGIVVILFLLLGRFDYHNYVPLIIFIFFFIATMPGFINWRKQEVITIE